MPSITASRRLLLGLTAALLGACTTTQPVSVSTDYDKNTNFGAYRTYDWYPMEPATTRGTAEAATPGGTTAPATGAPATATPAAATYDTFADRRIRAALDAQLPAKGLTRATAGKADLRIAYDISVKAEQRADPTTAFAPGFGYGYSYWYGYRYNYGFNRFGPGAYQPINTYNVGTVVVDFVDANANELVWRGVGESVVDPGSVTEESINKIVAGILAKYPPKAK